MTYDDRSLKETMQDADAKLRTANALNLAQIGLQGAQVRLQADALNEQRETNRRLEELGVTQAQLVELDRSIDANIREGSRTLGELKNAADRMGGLLSEQNGLLAGIGGELHGMRVEQAYQNFAMWRQTPEGVRYMEWAKRAQDTVDLILRRTQRMEGARERDMRDNAHRLLADRVEKRGPEPERPSAPPCVAPTPPNEFTEKSLTGNGDKAAGVIMTVFSLAGLGIGVYHGWTNNAYMISIYGWLDGGSRAFVGSIIPGALGLVIGFVVGFVASVVITGFFFSPSKEECERYDKAKNEHEEAVKEYYQQVKDFNMRQEYYRQAYDDWLKARDRWSHIVSDDIPREARALTVQPTRWAVSNPMDVVRTLTGIMEQAPFRPPVVDMLPDPVPPALAAPESIPDTAPMMRAELEAMRLEEETFGPTSSESAKPDPWAVRD